METTAEQTHGDAMHYRGSDVNGICSPHRTPAVGTPRWGTGLSNLDLSPTGAQPMGGDRAAALFAHHNARCRC